MNTNLTCRNGHTWKADAGKTPCPICGTDSESLDGGSRSTAISDFGDELPPLPLNAVQSHLPAPGQRPQEIPGYNFVRELGRGGMGVVYEAFHVALNRTVALKVIRSGNFAGPEEIARFRIEAEAIARLQHPNIIQIFEVGEHGGLPYVALEFAAGGSLAARLDDGLLAPRAAAAFATVLARAVQHAHSRGVVHRDLKPANILLSREHDGSDKNEPTPVASFVPKITDFGLAKLLDDPGRTRSGHVMGTPSYMAPEQAAGKGELVGPSADVWALGAILYKTLTQSPPFRGDTSAETVQKVLTLDPVPPTQLASGIPRDLETICLKCLCKEPDRRYLTAGELADDLDRFLDGRPILARRTPAWERVAKWARRRPAAAALLGGGIAAGAAFAWLSYHSYRNLEDYNRDLENRNNTITQQASALETEKHSTTHERDRAEHNLVAALAVIDKMLVELGLRTVAHVPHLDRTRAAMLDDALILCDRLAESQGEDPRLRLFQAFTLERSGTILLHLNRYKDAEDRFDRAVELLARIGPNDPPQVNVGSVRNLHALLHLERGRLFLQTGNLTRAREEFTKVSGGLDGPKAAAPQDPEVDYLQAVADANLAKAAMDESDNKQAKLYLGRALHHTEAIVRSDAPDTAYLAVHANVLNTLGVAYLETGEMDRAGELFEKSTTAYRRLVADSPINPDYREEFARSNANFATILRKKGYLKRAGELLAESQAIREELARDHPAVGEYEVDLCWGYFQTGGYYAAKSDSKAAAEWYTKAIDRLTKSSTALSGDTGGRRLLGDVYRVRAAARARLNLYRGAVDDLEAASKFVRAEFLPVLDIDKGRLLIALGDMTKGLAAVEAALASPDVQAEQRWDAARIFSGVAKSANGTDYAKRAVEVLSIVEKTSYLTDPSRIEQLETDPDFAPIRARTDMKELLKRIKQ
ncbi:MAG TPA: protein kinase [Fimbriiglobus sp.]|jgi:serine/threonine protein kinase